MFKKVLKNYKNTFLLSFIFIFSTSLIDIVVTNTEIQIMMIVQGDTMQEAKTTNQGNETTQHEVAKPVQVVQQLRLISVIF